MIWLSFHHVTWILVPREKGVVAGAVGDRLGLELESVGRGYAGRRRRLTLAGQDGEDHVTAGDAGLQAPRRRRLLDGGHHHGRARSCEDLERTGGRRRRGRAA